MITAVLPVWRSPMISSRWPRPTGISASIALEPGLHRLVHRFARDDARRLYLDAAALRAFAISPLPSMATPSPSTTRPSSSIADRHIDDGAGAGDGVALAYAAVVAEYDDADIVGLEVQRHAAQAGAGEFHHLAGHDVLQAEHAGDAVAHRSAPGRSRRHRPRCRSWQSGA